MTESESNPDDGTADCGQAEPSELELGLLTSDGEWGEEAFRDAGEATFAGR